MVEKVELSNYLKNWGIEKEDYKKVEEGLKNLLFSTNQELHKEFAKYVYEKNIM